MSLKSSHAIAAYLPILTFVTLVSTPALAIRPQADPFPGFARTRSLAPLPDQDIGQAFVDTDTLRPAVVLPREPVVLENDGDDAILDASDAYVRAHAGFLGVSLAELGEPTIGRGPRLIYVHYDQVQAGVPIVGAGLDLRFAQNRLVLVRNYTVDSRDVDFDLRPAIVGQASIDRSHTELARAGWTGLRTTQPARLVIVPYAPGEKALGYRLAWETVTTTTQPRGRIRTYVDATDGRALVQYDELQYLTDTQLTVNGLVEPRRVGDTPVVEAFPYLDPVDITGSVTLAVEGSTDVPLTFTGFNTQIENNETPNGTDVVTVPEGVDTVFTWDDTNSTFAERNAFAAFQRVHQRMTDIAGDVEWLNTPVPINVGLDSECNAYWDGEGANFFRESDNCNDTARIADVVYHEVGHGLHQNIMIAGTWDGALSEGSADYMSATITNDSEIAPTFFKTGEGIRDLEPDRVYPNDLIGEVHEDGLIWGGALWDLRTALIAEYGYDVGMATTDLLFADALRGGPTISDGYWEVLAADDDDANLLNGTPHVCLINDAFGAHGLGPGPGAGVAFQHVALGAQAEEPVTVRTELFAQFPECGEFDPSTGSLYWRVAGSNLFTEVPLEPVAGEALTYEAEIPAVAAGEKVQYYFEAGAPGQRRAEPREAPDKYYEYYVGPLLTVFFDDFESGEGGWTHHFSRAPADPDSQAYADDWQHGEPMGLAGDPAAAFSGTNVWGNDLGQVENANGAYRPNVTNHLVSEAIDCRGFRGTRLQFRRWLNVEDGTYDQAKIRINGQPVWVNAAGTGSRHHRDENWYFFDIDISTWADAKVIRVEFELFSDSGLQMGGWTIDDVAVMATHTGPIPKQGCQCAVAPHSKRAPSWSFALLLLGLTAVFSRRRHAR